MLNVLETLNDELTKKTLFRKERTPKIIDSIRNWCIARRKELDEERESINSFFRNHMEDLVEKHMCVASYSTSIYNVYACGSLMVSVTHEADGIDEIEVDVTTADKGENHIGLAFTNLDKPDPSFGLMSSSRPDVTSNDIDYWLNYARLLKILDKEIEFILERAVEFMECLLDIEDNRLAEMMKLVEDEGLEEGEHTNEND